MTKKKLKYLFYTTLAIPLFATSIATNQTKLSFKNNQYASLKNQDRFLANLKHGRLQLPLGLSLIFNKAHAQEDSGDETCNAILDDARDKCELTWENASGGGYDHGALKYFNNSLCKVNDEATAGPTNVLCHFDRSMDMRPDLDNLPITITKSFGGMNIEVSIVEPTEDFAITNGYEGKGTVTVDGSVYMVIYWGGAGTESKGFLIEGDVAGLGGDRANYTYWDLSDPTAQTVQILAAEYPSGTFLSSSIASGRGDSVSYGSVLFNAETNAVTTQMVLIEDRRGSMENTTFGCFKMYAKGVKGGTMVIGKTRDEVTGDNFNDSGHAVTDALKTLADMDGAVLVDDPDTANGTGNLGGANAADMQVNLEGGFDPDITHDAIVFDKSCNDLNSSGAGVFGNGSAAVDFTYGPDDVF